MAPFHLTQHARPRIYRDRGGARSRTCLNFVLSALCTCHAIAPGFATYAQSILFDVSHCQLLVNCQSAALRRHLGGTATTSIARQWRPHIAPRNNNTLPTGTSTIANLATGDSDQGKLRRSPLFHLTRHARPWQDQEYDHISNRSEKDYNT